MAAGDARRRTAFPTVSRGSRAGLIVALAGALFLAGAAAAAPPLDSMRGATPIPQESTPPPLVNPDNSDARRIRNYAMQPPVVPHKVEGYQIDRNANRCMMCHGRTRTQESQAPMISVSHFTDRRGNFLAEVSPRRYFCLTCHVPQVPMNTLVENRFVDVDTLLQRGRGAAPNTGGGNK